MSDHQPIRTCIACRRKKNKHELLRVVRCADGRIEVDEKAGKPGRGAYLCLDAACFETAIKRKAILRSLGEKEPDGFLTQLMNVLDERH